MYVGIKFTNNASTQITKTLSATDTVITVANNAAAIFPKLNEGDYCILTIVDANRQYEIVKCTSRTDNEFTVVRAQEGTTAKSFQPGSSVELRLTADSILKVSEDASTVKVHATSDGTSVGKASAQDYGHVKLSDDFDTGQQALDGVCCSPFAFQQAVNRLLNISKVTLITESKTWIVPETATYTITAIGGGGSGGNGAQGTAINSYDGYNNIWVYMYAGGGGGAGGGAGQVVTKDVLLTKGTSVTITIGSANGSTTFGTYVTALAGSKGNNGGQSWYTIGQEPDWSGERYQQVVIPYAGQGGTIGTSYGTLPTNGRNGSVGAGWSYGYGGAGGIGATSLDVPYGNGGNGGRGGDGCIAYLDAQNIWATPGTPGTAGTQGCVKITVKLS